jgi:hypothetical protein
MNDLQFASAVLGASLGVFAAVLARKVWVMLDPNPRNQRRVIRKARRILREEQRNRKVNEERSQEAHEWTRRVSDAGDDFVSCNRCGSHINGN